MKIRIANSDDVNRIYEIEESSFPNPWSIDSLFFQIVEDELSDVYVVCDGDLILGFIGIMKIFDEIHITNIAIDPKYRGNNYSDFLMDYIVKYADSNNFKITLEVGTDNNVALNLYEKYNFEISGKRRDYYGKGKDAYIMWR